MEVTMKMNRMGHIEVWKGDSTNKEADLYIQLESDVETIKNEIGKEWARELNGGWAVVGRQIDDLWFGDSE